MTTNEARYALDEAFNAWILTIFNINESDVDSSAFAELLNDIEAMA